MSEKRFKAFRKFNRAILNPITRSLIAGRVSFCSLVYHLGRRSGKEYATPVMAVIKDGHIYIPLTYGPDTDWHLNACIQGLPKSYSFCRCFDVVSSVLTQTASEKRSVWCSKAIRICPEITWSI